jgi:hypothetical protein
VNRIFDCPLVFLFSPSFLPIGIAINFKNRVLTRIEGGFKNGFYLGAAVTITF